MAKVANDDADLEGKLLVTAEDNQTITALKTFNRGGANPPFVVGNAGAATVTNLDADLLDGLQGADYQNANNLITGTVPGARLPNPLPAISGENLISLQAANVIGAALRWLLTGRTSVELASALSDPGQAALAYDSTISTIVASQNGKAYASFSEVIFRQMTPSAPLTGTTAETTLFSGTLQGGRLGISRILRIRAAFRFLNNTGAALTYTIRVKLGATTVYTEVFSTNADANARAAWMDLELWAAGAQNVQRAAGEFHIAVGPSTAGNANSVNASFLAVNDTPIAEDTSTDKTVTVTGQLSNAGITLTMLKLAGELL